MPHLQKRVYPGVSDPLKHVDSHMMPLLCSMILQINPHTIQIQLWDTNPSLYEPSILLSIVVVRQRRAKRIQFCRGKRRSDLRRLYCSGIVQIIIAYWEGKDRNLMIEYRWQTRALIQRKPARMISCTCRMGLLSVGPDLNTHSHKVMGILTQRRQLLLCNHLLIREPWVPMAKLVSLIINTYKYWHSFSHFLLSLTSILSQF